MGPWADISTSVIDGKHQDCLYAVKAHAGEIMDIAICGDTITSSSRDRTAQVFHKDAEGWTLTQTLDDHTASVNRVLLLDSGNKLLTCSADRTIVIRELCRREAINGSITMAYVPVRTLTTKASPVHMTPLSDSTLIVSTMDRQIQKFDLNTGKGFGSFKATDESGDAVVMDSVTVSKDKGFPRARILAGISTTDKSIRLYDLSGNLIDKEWGHTEGVSDVVLLEREPQKGEETGQTIVISTGSDGTIMIWGFTPKNSEPEPATVVDTDGTANVTSQKKEMTATRPPLRRVLSRTELMDFTPKPGGSAQSSRPASSHTGNTSPPRTLRRKTSAYGMNRTTSAKGVPTLPAVLPGTVSTASSATPTPSTTSDDSASPSTPLFGADVTKRTSVGRKSISPPASLREGRKTRNRTPSPTTTKKAPTVPTPLRRGSSTTRTRVRGHSVGSVDTPILGTGGAGNMNGLAESLSRSLRSFRKKIDAGAKEGVNPEVLKELQRELGLTVKELGATGDREGKSNRGRSNASNRSLGPQDVAGRDLMTQLLDTYSERLVSIVSERLETKAPLTRERKKKMVETSGEG